MFPLFLRPEHKLHGRMFLVFCFRRVSVEFPVSPPHRLLDLRNVNVGRTLPRHLSSCLRARWLFSFVLHPAASPLNRPLPPGSHLSVENPLSSPVCSHNRQLRLTSSRRENARWPFTSWFGPSPAPEEQGLPEASLPPLGTETRSLTGGWGTRTQSSRLRGDGAFVMDPGTFGQPPFCSEPLSDL